MIVDCFRQERTLNSSSELLKIWLKMKASWSVQIFRQEGDTLSWPGAFLIFCLWNSWHTSCSQILSAGGRSRGRGEESGSGCRWLFDVRAGEGVCEWWLIKPVGNRFGNTLLSSGSWRLSTVMGESFLQLVMSGRPLYANTGSFTKTCF